MTDEQILEWADEFKRRTGVWPKREDGPILDAPGETWLAAHSALASGIRGLQGGSSLAQLLENRRAAIKS